MDTVADGVYNLIESLLPHDVLGSEYSSDLFSLIHAAYAKDKQTPSLTDLALFCCQAVGGDVHRAIPIAAAWRLLHLAAQVLDDIEDNEPNSVFPATLRQPQAVNVSTGLIFMAQRALSSGLQRQGVPAFRSLAILDDFGGTILRTCAGQHADLAAQNATDLSLEQYWAIVAAKSSDFFALACRAGAMLGTEDTRLIARYTEFGYNLGVLIQIGDDLVGLQESGVRNDLAAGQQTLPILYALKVAPPRQQATLRRLLLQAPDDAEAEVEARRMIVALGAPTYLMVKAQVHRQQAEDALPATSQFGQVHDQLLALADRAMPGSSLI
jgi:competence protein ComQ